jgi:hypothetical protein
VELPTIDQPIECGGWEMFTRPSINLDEDAQRLLPGFHQP